MMNDPRESGQAEEDRRAGLCASCVHVQIVTSDRGSRFYMCRRSLTDARFPRYPPIPVLACIGYEPRAAPQRPETPT
jgi:hypothetical protein